MEDSSDFQIDFENLSGIPILLENDETHEENDLYEEIVQKGKKAYLCTASGCGKIFKFKSEITRHIIIHQKDRPYVCTFGDCKKNFKRADALENHLRIHEGILPFPCDVPGCDRSFVTKAALRYHKIKHNNDRSFKCEFPGCDKSFIIASQLKQHHKAFPFHLNRQQETPVEDTPQKIMRHGTEAQEVCNNDLFQTEDQDCCDKIQWEIYNQCHDDLNENTQEKFETIFQYIRNENKILKGQLQVEKQSTKILQKKDTVDFSCGDQTEPIIANEPSIFFDGNELKFLEFLKERDYDS